MSSLPQPELVAMPGTELYQLSADFRIWLPVSRMWLSIRNGYVFNGCSLPKILWMFVGSPFDPNYSAPAIAHDALDQSELLPRAITDKEFHALLKRNGRKSARRAGSFYFGVRHLRWDARGDHTLKSVQSAREFCRLEETGETK